MLIEREIQIDMGHRVPNHKSKCRNLHGHRYKIVVGVDDKVITTPGSSDEGMVIDFADLKQIMMEHIDAKLDHGFMMYEQDAFIQDFLNYRDQEEQKIIVVPFIPTAENISEYIFKNIAEALKEKGIKLRHVKVWETPNCMAMYEER